jgi:hypothetical protein
MSVEFKQEFQVDNVHTPQVQEQFQEGDIQGLQQEQGGYEQQEEQELQQQEQPMEESQEGEEEESPAAEKRRKYRDPAKTRINQIQRERYAAIDEANRLRDENERLRRIAALSTETASRQFEDNVAQRFDRAKQLKMQAYESGDIKAQTDADVELADAMADFKSHNNWKAQEALKAQEAQYQPRQPIVQGPIVNEREARGWIERNSWANPNTQDYDPELFTIADNAASQLDLYCYKNGQAHLIQSPEYFQQLDNYMEQARQQLESQPRQSYGRSQIPMRQPGRGGVMPVRGSNNAQASGRQKTPLTPEQKSMAQSLGVSEDLYRQEMLRDMKEKPDRYTYRGGR